jgi:DGQHR domain-containing protein
MMHDPIIFPCVPVTQPIGTFYVGVMPAGVLTGIAWTDVRRLANKDRDFENYLGIQRPLNPKRVKEICKYVATYDATFPNAIIIAVHAKCAAIDKDGSSMALTPFAGDDDIAPIPYEAMARIIDGQHRVAGLKDFEGPDFDVIVTVFVSIDVAEQANIFATVNLAQTKVNKSLAFDLFALAQSRSPQKTCHDIAVALDQSSNSPLNSRIKRLGVATDGRFNETITQATFVEALMKYISSNPASDRDLLMRGKRPPLASADQLLKMPFRNLFIEERDLGIAKVVRNLFTAVSRRWPGAWNDFGQGNMLNKTNGFRGIMRFLKPSYLHITSPGGAADTEDFEKLLGRIEAGSDYFTTERFPPGSSGEGRLARYLIEAAKLE